MAVGLLKENRVMKATINATKQMTMYQVLEDIDEFVTWGDIAKEYFDKSASWFYHKMDGRDGNGKPTEFNMSERAQLKGALCDLANRIRRAADRIEI